MKEELAVLSRLRHHVRLLAAYSRIVGFCLAMAIGAVAPIHAAIADTLFEALGGNPGIAKITGNALTLYFADPRLAGDFDNVNREWLEPRFTTFLCHIADGPCQYKGRSMAAAHKGLHISQIRFNAAVEDLQIAMNQAGTSFRVQNRLLARLAPMEHVIVTK